MYDTTERNLTETERRALVERREELAAWPTVVAAASSDWPRRVRWIFVLALIGISALYLAPSLFPFAGAAVLVLVLWILTSGRGPREIEERRQELESRVESLVRSIDRVLEGGHVFASRVEARAVRGIEAWAPESGEVWVFDVGAGNLLALDAARDFPDQPDAPWPADRFTILRAEPEGESVLVVVEGGPLEPLDLVTQREVAFGRYVEGEGEPRMGLFGGSLANLARDFEPRAATGLDAEAPGRRAE